MIPEIKRQLMHYERNLINLETTSDFDSDAEQGLDEPEDEVYLKNQIR